MLSFLGSLKFKYCNTVLHTLTVASSPGPPIVRDEATLTVHVSLHACRYGVKSVPNYTV